VILVTAFFITPSALSALPASVANSLTRLMAPVLVVGRDRTVRLDRGHAYLTASGALLGIRERPERFFPGK
jgi:VIT1/CCC1 family predicted Fe2+/Mn2+ transporter